ncbi:hypothetical protein [Idiomarina ramblicola]|uniref:Lipoprotein n=1 Tax=Idiomarina ramblicola TaxID=263724 RepID=A0A432Z5Y0_9GAMM|nr:hypothetical protein [Idiomarina ramblicola]RUO73290.1 hypothetical protein CWI78_02250 [Idiomarina ramblicola]
MKVANLTVILLTLFTLSACGGGSDSETGTTTPPPTGGGNDGGDDNDGDGGTGVTISGKVIDGYVVGATVFLDINGNGQLDAGEPSGKSKEGGEYAVDMSDVDESVQECLAFAPVVVDVPVGAIDEDLGEVEEAYTMTIPPLNEDAFDEAHITPLTSVLWETFQNDFAIEDGIEDPVLACERLLENNELISQFKDRLDRTLVKMTEDYNISEETIYGDFVESGDTEAYDLAQTIVKGLKMSLAETKAIMDESPNAVPQISYLKEDGQWVRDEYVYMPAREVSSDQWSADARVSAKTEVVSDDFEQRFETIWVYNRRSSFKNIDEAQAQVSYYEETCNMADHFEWTGDRDAAQTQVIEVVNNSDSCLGFRSKMITVHNYTDTNDQLGEMYSYMINYEFDAAAYPLFDYMEDFYTRKESLNIDSIVSDATSYEFSMSQDYDAAQLMETFAMVETRTREMDGENLVDTRRTYSSEDGASWERRTTYPDGTYNDECKDVGETEWSACE